MSTENTENIVFEKDNNQIIQEGSHFFTRTTENGESFESADYNTLERAKESLGIVPTTEENNKLLADFMGAKYNKDVSFNIEKNDLWLPKHGICNFQLASTGKRLKYHSDWNWLMEVVEKIECKRDGRCLMDNDDILAYVTIESQYCEIRVYECIFEPEKEFPTKLEAVYSACVQFVKWYNSKPELQC
jgi:hypothetical protein